MTPSDFETRASDLLRQYADPITPRRDLAAALREQLGHDPAVPLRRRTLADRYPIVPLVSAAALLALIVGIVGTVRFAISNAAKSPTGGLSAVILPQVKVMAVAADATRTVVTFRMDFPPGHPGLLPDPASVYLTDSSGRTYRNAIARSLLTSTGPSATATVVFAPLDPALFGAPQMLTLTVVNLTSTAAATPASSPVPTLRGPWQTAFAVTPAPATSLPAPISTVTSGPIALQVTQVDWSETANTLDQGSGGLRVRLRVSGLVPPPTAYVTSVSFLFASDYATPLLSASASEGARFTLDLPDGTHALAALVVPLLPGGQIPSGTPSDAFIAPDGTTTIDVVFLVARPTTAADLTLHLDSLRYSFFDGQAETRTLPGPWSFTIAAR